jgi:uncharacterized membrane protein
MKRLLGSAVAGLLVAVIGVSLIGAVAAWVWSLVWASHNYGMLGIVGWFVASMWFYGSLLYFFTGPSSNGRTADSDSVNRGSNP